ncbi:MAG TPA: MazG nucleotide pyrophosphohydrolase domain-containing protein [bacterium]|nr:MazG nucleotide pyrophosphohydrolase domain-containing protein [bacterium]
MAKPVPDTGHPFDDLVALMATLRGEGGCPWDHEQTYESLRKYVLEEAQEVVEAIDKGDRRELMEELGDMIFEAVFLAQLLAEEGQFTIRDSLVHMKEKMVRRHPHVFGEGHAATPEDVMKSWAEIKAQEKAARAAEGEPGGGGQ